MAIDSSDHMARTIEFQTAVVHLTGELAGAIEVPIFVGQRNLLHSELEDLALQVDGESRLLRPVRREYFAGLLRLLYFSQHLRETRQLPGSLQLHWGESHSQDTCGMELMFKEAPSSRLGAD